MDYLNVPKFVFDLWSYCSLSAGDRQLIIGNLFYKVEMEMIMKYSDHGQTKSRIP